MDCTKTYPYDKKFMYDKINGNMLFVIQKSENSVIVYIENGRNSIIKLPIEDLEEDLILNNIIIGEPDIMRLLYGRI